MSEGLLVIVDQTEEGMTARTVLRRARGVSQRLIRKIQHGSGEGGGALYINGNNARFCDRVKAGDEIKLAFPDEETWMEPESIPLNILYEDSDILVVDKQPGIVVHPTKGSREGTLANAVVFHMHSRGENYRPRFISRLDMGTSGVLIVGKNSHAQDSLAKQNAAGAVEKTYFAALVGRLEDSLPPEGVIDLPIGLAQPGEPRRAVIPEAEGGHTSQTAYEVVSVHMVTADYAAVVATAAAAITATDYAAAATAAATTATTATDYAAAATAVAVAENEPSREPQARTPAITIIRAHLITGRTHQIRVHFAHYGHPVLGDALYGEPSTLISRQALHAAEIAFAHPVTGLQLRFAAPLPPDMERICMYEQ